MENNQTSESSAPRISSKQYESISFGIFLLFVGTVALLTNIGIINWSFLLDLFLRYWPLFIIVAGVKTVGNAQLGRFFGLAVDVLFSAVIIIALIFAGDKLLPNISDLPREVKTMTVPFSNFSDAISAEYSLTFGASDFTVTDKMSDTFLKMTGPKEFSVEPKLGLNKVLRITTENNTVDRFYRFSSLKTPNKYSVDLGVTELNSSMEIISGASNGNIILDELKLSSLTSKLGAGDLTIELANASVPQTIDINVGAGRTVVKIAGNKKVKVTYSIGAGSLKLKSTSENLDKEFGGIGDNGVYEMTPNADVLINVKVGAGEVQVLLD